MADAPIIEGPDKGKAFFSHAKTAGASGNFDFAITLYIEGLLREPENIEEHKALYEISLRRKATGGKAPGGIFGPKLPCKGKTPKDNMLNAEWQLAMEPGVVSYMLTIIRSAATGSYAPVVRWIAGILMFANKLKPKKEIYLEVADILEKLNTVEDLRQAMECIRLAAELAPADMDLGTRAKDVAANLTLLEGQYEKQEDFKESLANKKGTHQLNQEDNLNKSEEYRNTVVDAAKADYDKNPKDHQLISKYYKALVAMDDEDHENIAIEVLNKAYKETKTYAYRNVIGDIRIKQHKRNVRMLQEATKAEPDDKGLVAHLHEAQKERLAFELELYKERVQHYPTDMGLQYELGRRLFQSKRYDEAIASLQLAQNNAKFRADSLFLLGCSFQAENLKSEAVDTLKRAIDAYDLADTGDAKAKDMYYHLGLAYTATDAKTEAVATFSKLMQWDYSYRDVRKRLDDLRNG